jgi:hypothetical protein
MTCIWVLAGAGDVGVVVVEYVELSWSSMVPATQWGLQDHLADRRPLPGAV